MDLSPHTTTITPVDEKLWLGSKHGLDCPETITLDVEGGSFDGVIVDNGDGWGYIPSGCALIGPSQGLYSLQSGATDAEGHLVESVRVRISDSDGTVTAGGALLWHGVVVEDKVPGTFDGSANGATFIRYV